MKNQNKYNNIYIFSDSDISMGVCSGRYKAKKNLEKVNRIKILSKEVSNKTNLTLIWVPGHAEVKQNEIVDSLAVKGAEGNKQKTTEKEFKKFWR